MKNRRSSSDHEMDYTEYSANDDILALGFSFENMQIQNHVLDPERGTSTSTPMGLYHDDDGDEGLRLAFDCDETLPDRFNDEMKHSDREVPTADLLGLGTEMPTIGLIDTTSPYFDPWPRASETVKSHIASEAKAQVPCSSLSLLQKQVWTSTMSEDAIEVHLAGTGEGAVFHSNWKDPERPACQRDLRVPVKKQEGYPDEEMAAKKASTNQYRYHTQESKSDAASYEVIKDTDLWDSSLRDMTGKNSLVTQTQTTTPETPFRLYYLSDSSDVDDEYNVDSVAAAPSPFPISGAGPLPSNMRSAGAYSGSRLSSERPAAPAPAPSPFTLPVEWTKNSPGRRVGRVAGQPASTQHQPTRPYASKGQNGTPTSFAHAPAPALAPALAPVPLDGTVNLSSKRVDSAAVQQPASAKNKTSTTEASRGKYGSAQSLISSTTASAPPPFLLHGTITMPSKERVESTTAKQPSSVAQKSTNTFANAVLNGPSRPPVPPAPCPSQPPVHSTPVPSLEGTKTLPCKKTVGSAIRDKPCSVQQVQVKPSSYASAVKGGLGTPEQAMRSAAHVASPHHLNRAASSDLADHNNKRARLELSREDAQEKHTPATRWDSGHSKVDREPRLHRDKQESLYPKHFQGEPNQSLQEKAPTRGSLPKRTARKDGHSKESKFGKYKNGHPTRNRVIHSETLPTKDILANEVCLLVDTSNETMKKLLAPLRPNVGTFLDLVSSASGRELRLGILTPDKELDFTSDKATVLSFSHDALREGEMNGTRERGPFSVLAGLQQSLLRLNKLSWSGDSCQYVYIFTSLGAADIDDIVSKQKLLGVLRDLTAHLPRRAKVLVGRWKNDNDLLFEAIRTMPHHGFDFLNVKSMASHVVPDHALLHACFSSMTELKAKSRRVTIGEKHLGRFVHRRLKMDKEGDIVAKVTMYQAKPVETIQHITSNAEPDFVCKEIWMKRGMAEIRLTKHRVLTFGKLGDEKGKWKEDVMLKSFKLDVIAGKTVPGNQNYYKSLAFVSAAAQFLACQYNSSHRPEHCDKIRFLRCCVIEASGRHWFAEHFVASERKDSSEFVEYMNAAGNWNEDVADESLLRFALTCFKLSGGDFMLTGLKGVRRGGVFVLTLPTLLSRNCVDPNISQCNKEYMKVCRKETKELLQELDAPRSPKRNNGMFGWFG